MADIALSKVIMDRGYVKIWRKITDWEWYKDTNCFRVMMHLIITANHKDCKWQGIEVKRGQKITGIHAFSEQISLSSQKILTALKKLKMTNEITIKSTNKYSIITICKYDTYQDKIIANNKQNDSIDNNQITNEQQTNNKQITTNKNDKNDKNDKKIKHKEPDLGSGDNVLKTNPTTQLVLSMSAEEDPCSEIFEKYIEHRKKIKRAMTDHAKDLMRKELKKLSGGDLSIAQKIVEASIANGWIGLFPLSKNNFKSDPGALNQDIAKNQIGYVEKLKMEALKICGK